MYRYSTNVGTKQKNAKFLPPIAETCREIAANCHEGV